MWCTHDITNNSKTEMDQVVTCLKMLCGLRFSLSCLWLCFAVTMIPFCCWLLLLAGDVEANPCSQSIWMQLFTLIRGEKKGSEQAICIIPKTNVSYQSQIPYANPEQKRDASWAYSKASHAADPEPKRMASRAYSKASYTVDPEPKRVPHKPTLKQLSYSADAEPKRGTSWASSKASYTADPEPKRVVSQTYSKAIKILC